MVFNIVVHSEPTAGHWGEVPSLPGRYSQGETLEELQASLRETIGGYLEVLRSEGRSPEPDVRVLELAL